MCVRAFPALALAYLLVLAACEKSELDTSGEPADDLVLIGEQASDDIAVALYAADSLKVGWNQVYFQITDLTTNTAVTQAQIRQYPVMRMDSLSHGCPYTDPDDRADDDNLFTAEIVFTMASGMMGTWRDSVVVERPELNRVYPLVFADLPVRETGRKQNLVVTTPDFATIIYVVTLNFPEEPQVGSNAFILTVHQMESMMNFPPVADVTIAVDPQMPDMGHGSTGNVDPVYTANGRYEGTVTGRSISRSPGTAPRWGPFSSR
jgi:hypothetical protein